MGTTICKSGEWYFQFSSVSDSPEPAIAMTRDELVAYFREEEGRRGVEELTHRLQRVADHGTSSYDPDDDVGSVLLCNRAGAKETWLTEEELVACLVARRTNPGLRRPKGLRLVHSDDPCQWCGERERHKRECSS